MCAEYQVWTGVSAWPMAQDIASGVDSHILETHRPEGRCIGVGPHSLFKGRGRNFAQPRLIHERDRLSLSRRLERGLHGRLSQYTRHRLGGWLRQHAGWRDDEREHRNAQVG
jgi:hypothetical protein